MIIVVGGEKGGTGKTTLASNLAVYRARLGRDVLILDTDRQGSISRWSAIRACARGKPAIACVAKFEAVDDAVRDMAQRYQDVVIDSGAGDSPALRSALLIADMFVVPVRPSMLDLWTAEHLEQLVKLARGFNRALKLKIVLSQVPTHPLITEKKDAAELLATFKSLELASTIVHERKTYRDAIIKGRNVQEMDNAKARLELESLAREIYGDAA